MLLETAGVASLAAIVASWLVFDGQSIFVYRGGLVALAAATSVVMLAAVNPKPGVVACVLSVRPLRGLGVISYGLYLWHWQVLQLLNTERTGLAGAPLLALQLVISLMAALLSYFAIERPVRSARLVSAKQAWVVVPAMFALVTVRSLFMIRAPKIDVYAFPKPIAFDATRFVDDVGRPRRPRVLVVGDSVGDSLAGALTRREHATGVEVFNRARIGCGVQREVTRIRFPDGTIAPDGEGCADAIDAWPAEIARTKPDGVALVLGYAGGLDKEVKGAWTTPCDTGFLSWYRGQLVDALRTLSTAGVPMTITTAPYKNDGAHPSVMRDRDTQCMNNLYAGLKADFPQLAIVDLNAHVCPKGVCRASVEGQAMRPDGLHFHGASAILIGNWLVAQVLKPTR